MVTTKLPYHQPFNRRDIFPDPCSLRHCPHLRLQDLSGAQSRAFWDHSDRQDLSLADEFWVYARSPPFAGQSSCHVVPEAALAGGRQISHQFCKIFWGNGAYIPLLQILRDIHRQTSRVPSQIRRSLARRLREGKYLILHDFIIVSNRKLSIK
jgi:hypothetical protein